jgi:hypothetical protein
MQWLVSPRARAEEGYGMFAIRNAWLAVGVLNAFIGSAGAAERLAVTREAAGPEAEWLFIQTAAGSRFDGSVLRLERGIITLT